MRPPQVAELAAALAGLLAIASGPLACTEQPEIDGTLISNVTLISPERAAPVPGAWVLIEGDRITDVGTGEPFVNARRVIDGSGRYLTPGLIDGHVHLEGPPGIEFPIRDELRPLVDAYYAQMPRSYLYFGFTTVIDLNVLSREFIDSVKAVPLGPDVFDCDGALALANGYPMVFFPPETRFESHPNFLYDERQADAIPDRYAPEDHSPAAVVQRVADAGGICVKTHHEDGFGPQSIWPTPTPELISEVVSEARSRDLTATMHANSYAAYRFAVEADVDLIVHGMWNWDGLGNGPGDDGQSDADRGGERSPGDGRDDGPAALPEEIRAVADELIARDIAFMPTLRVLGGLQSLFDPDFLADPRLRAVLPAALIEWYGTADGQWFANEMRRDFDGLPDDQIPPRIQLGIDQGAAVATYLVDRGGRLVFGSDTPSSPTFGNPPGYNGFLELQTLAAIGISSERLFRAATIDVARAFGLDQTLGTVEPGKTANLLLLGADPLASVDAWDTIELVVVGGEVVRRTDVAANQADLSPAG